MTTAYVIRYTHNILDNDNKPTGKTSTYISTITHNTLEEAKDALNRPPSTQTTKAEILPITINDQEILLTAEYTIEQRTIPVPVVTIK